MATTAAGTGPVSTWKTGRTTYAADGLPSRRSGPMTYADGHLFVLGEQGDVALVPATPAGFTIKSRFQLPSAGQGPLWAHPVIHAG